MRPKRDKRLPNRFDDYDIEISCLALLSEFKDTKLIGDEINVLKRNENWELADRPKNQEVISNRWIFRVKNRWVFRVKEDDEGTSDYEARGFEQTFEEISPIHAPVARLSTLRVL